MDRELKKVGFGQVRVYTHFEMSGQGKLGMGWENPGSGGDEKSTLENI